MSVFTTVSPEQLSAWLRNYSIGVLTDLQGILSGIENTNYFVTTTHGRFVLTLFEKLTRRELPFYVNLMAHLSSHGLPCPKPIANLQNELLGELNGKPATIVTCLSGQPVLEPTPAQCARVGEVLADMHLAGRTYKGHLDNLRGPAWWSACAPDIYPFLDAEDAALLRSEIEFQARQDREGLPRGVVHADLFRDNVLFETGADASQSQEAPRLSGFFDFYFAGVDSWLFDIAVCMNDWCIDLQTGAADAQRSRALLAAYAAVRPLTQAERRLLPAMARAGALRFWISRLWDLHLPREASMLKPHDPTHFERVLRQRVAAPLRIDCAQQ